MTRSIFVVLALTAFGAVPCFAQHVHSEASPSVITADGSVNPDLIPDLTANRLFFLAYLELPARIQKIMEEKEKSCQSDRATQI